MSAARGARRDRAQAVAKEEIAELERRARRDGVDGDYLKGRSACCRGPLQSCNAGRLVQKQALGRSPLLVDEHSAHRLPSFVSHNMLR